MQRIKLAGLKTADCRVSDYRGMRTAAQNFRLARFGRLETGAQRIRLAKSGDCNAEYQTSKLWRLQRRVPIRLARSGDCSAKTQTIEI